MCVKHWNDQSCNDLKLQPIWCEFATIISPLSLKLKMLLWYFLISTDRFNFVRVFLLRCCPEKQRNSTDVLSDQSQFLTSTSATVIGLTRCQKYKSNLKVATCVLLLRHTIPRLKNRLLQVEFLLRPFSGNHLVPGGPADWISYLLLCVFVCVCFHVISLKQIISFCFQHT